MVDQHYIAVDLGAESGRVMLAKIGADGVCLREMHRFSNEPLRAAEHLEWNIAKLWADVQVGIAKAVAEEKHVAAIGVDTWGVDYGLLDARGKLLANPVHYRDTRTAGMPEKFFSRMARENLYSIAGVQTLELNTLFQLCYLARHQESILEKAKTLLYIPDLLTYWLCGFIGHEYTIASTSQMLDARKRIYAPEILANIPLRADILPAIISPGTVVGKLLPGLQGLPVDACGVPVVAVGSHDTASAVAGVPAMGKDWLFLSSGTWSLLGAEIDEPILTRQAMEFNLTNEGGVGGTIRLIKNIPGMWLLQECRRAWSAAGQSLNYAELVNLARVAPSHTALLNPEYSGLMQPGDMPAKIAKQCHRTGQPIPESPGEFARIIFESLAVTYASVCAMLTAVTGRQFSQLYIVGGGSQNDLLNQMTADATGLKVFAGPVEATAIGNVLVQAMAVGQIESLDTGRRLVAKTASIRHFVPRGTDRWIAWAEKIKRTPAYMNE